MSRIVLDSCIQRGVSEKLVGMLAANSSRHESAHLCACERVCLWVHNHTADCLWLITTRTWVDSNGGQNIGDSSIVLEDAYFSYVHGSRTVNELLYVRAACSVYL